MTERLPPFASAELKLKRARLHHAALKQEVASFFRGKPIAVIVEKPSDNNPSEFHVWTARVAKDVPVDLATVIGDVVHNLRSGLDLLATDLVRLNSGDQNNVYFPFGRDAEHLEGQIKDKHFRRAHRDVVDLLRSLKPYTGGNTALRGLHDLDIMDKHQALVPTICAAQTHPYRFFTPTGSFDFPSFKTSVADGYRFAFLPPVSNMPLGFEVPTDFSLVFQEDTPFAGREVVETLHALCENVAGVLKAFASLCKGQAFPESTSTKGGGLGQGIIAPFSAMGIK